MTDKYDGVLGKIISILPQRKGDSLMTVMCMHTRHGDEELESDEC